jgi:crotonobetaine/carnitine-CoA ligase
VKSEYEAGEDLLKVCLVLRPGARLTPEELLDYCQPRMPYFALPRYVEFLDALPKTPTEKVRKAALREVALTPGTWDREAAGYRVQRPGRAPAASRSA